MEYNCSSYRGHDKLLKGFHVEELLQQRQEREQHYQGPAKANPAAVRALEGTPPRPAQCRTVGKQLTPLGPSLIAHYSFACVHVRARVRACCASLHLSLAWLGSWPPSLTTT